MRDIMLFQNEEFGEVRAIEIDGEVRFVAKDVCDILDITWNGSKTLAKVPDKHKGVVNFATPGGEQDLLCVSESGLYRLVMRSSKPEAEAFQDWITDEVLPSIRKHGAYMTPQTIEDVLLNPDTIIRLATDLKEERARRIEAERTKAMIGSKREATALGRLSAKTKENAVLKDKLGEGENWRQCKAIDWVPQVFAVSRGLWSALGKSMTRLSKDMGYEVKKVADPAYGSINAYHVNVWGKFKDMIDDDLNIMKDYRIDVPFLREAKSKKLFN